LSGSQVGGFLILPELSNSGSPPAEPGVYLKEIITIKEGSLSKVNPKLITADKEFAKCAISEGLTIWNLA
jgi:hypothetical protein